MPTFPVSTLQNQFIWSRSNGQKVNPAVCNSHKQLDVKTCQNMSKRTNWQTLRCLRLWNFDSVNVCSVHNARARICMTIAAGITAQQEFMRRMTDRAVCVCVNRLRLVGSRASRELRWGESASRELVLMGNVKCCSRGGVWLAPGLHCALRSHLGDDPCRSCPDTLNSKIHVHDVVTQFLYKHKLPETLHESWKD